MIHMDTKINQKPNQLINQPDPPPKLKTPNPKQNRRKDLQFQFAKIAETGPYFDGQVHRGAFTMFHDMSEHLMADVEARRPKVVTFTGPWGCSCVLCVCWFACFRAPP